jgi:amino acid transporter
LLLLLAAARSIYGMAAAGVLPRNLARLTSTQVPREAMIVILVLTLALILAGDLSGVARLTDAVVLISFICVNLGLATLGVRKQIPGSAPARARDIAVSTAGALMCAWLLWHGGWEWILAASAVAGLGAGWLLARRGRQEGSQTSG